MLLAVASAVRARICDTRLLLHLRYESRAVSMEEMDGLRRTLRLSNERRDGRRLDLSDLDA